MKNKILWVVLAIIILIGVGYSLSSKKTTTSTTASTIKIGVVAPLTGPLAEYGEAFKNGITLAQEKLNNNKFEFIFEDGAYDSGKSISAYNKLRDLNHVDAILNWGDSPSQAIAPIAKNDTIPFLAVTTIPAVAEMGSNIIRTLNTSEEDAVATWSYLRSKNYTNIGIVKLEASYFNNLLAALIKNKQPNEKVTVIDTYLSYGDKDFRTTISKIKNQQYDAIGVFLGGGQISQFYNQAASLSLKTSTFGTDFFENQSDIDAAGKNINGAVYVNYDVSDAFRNTYQTRFKNVSQIAYAGNGYDTVMMLNSSKDAQKDSIIASLKDVKDYSGILGKWNFVETATDRYLSSPFHVKVIQDGLIKTIK